MCCVFKNSRSFVTLCLNLGRLPVTPVDFDTSHSSVISRTLGSLAVGRLNDTRTLPPLTEQAGALSMATLLQPGPSQSLEPRRDASTSAKWEKRWWVGS